ncbi:MAG TPA: hypothetical protein DHW82_07520 [Spirochaetia bacterium]|nr:MAG: hypothetical protein A2Y41_02715 [Spirochaetes bacterium GWB1_36_13]HCL56842.1 hypothetical protein [Spirochaetia bacterium]
MISDMQIRYNGMKLLREHLGIVEAEKFIALIKKESFNYTEWQRTLWSDQSVDDIFHQAKKFYEIDQ